MKRILFVLMSLVILFQVSCAPPVEVGQTSMAVTVPDAINLAIGVGLTTLVALGMAYLFQTVGIDLRDLTAPIAVSLSAFVVSELQNVVNWVPEVYDPWLNILFKIIVVLVAPVGLLAWRKYMVKTAQGAAAIETGRLL